MFYNVKITSYVAILMLFTVVPRIYASNGWYLLIPPIRQGITDEEILRQFPQWGTTTKEVLHDIAPSVMGEWSAPLSRWDHRSSFDTSEECEGTRVHMIKAAKAKEPEIRRMYPDGYPTLQTIFLMHSRCIASDDPRLIPS